MRCVLVGILLAACSSAAPRGPAWPTSRTKPTDGGESLSPRAAARAIAAVVEDDKPTDRATDKPAEPAAAPAIDRATTTIPVLPPDDDPITAEDIVIEVDGSAP